MASTHIWTPGMAGPLDEFIGRVQRMIGAFMAEQALPAAEVKLELADGSRYVLATATADPGFGFFSFTPHRREDEEPKRVVVPVGAVKVIEISAPDPERPFGFDLGAAE